MFCWRWRSAGTVHRMVDWRVCLKAVGLVDLMEFQSVVQLVVKMGHWMVDKMDESMVESMVELKGFQRVDWKAGK